MPTSGKWVPLYADCIILLYSGAPNNTSASIEMLR